MAKQNKKTVKKDRSGTKDDVKNVIIGLVLFLGVLSIAYSTVVIVWGTDGVLPMVLVAPQAVLAVVISLKQFFKQGE